jgi:DNA-binding HxlR family transcriptional regulator
MPGKTDLGQLNCSLARALEIVGDWWSMLIIRDACLGVSRFGEFRASLGIAKNILATRLDYLVRQGILARDGSERRPLYRLTEKGLALLPALVALMQWGDKWMSKDRPPILVTDRRGAPVAPVGVRTRTGALSPAEVRFQPGPGATGRTRAFLTALQSRLDSRPRGAAR